MDEKERLIRELDHSRAIMRRRLQDLEAAHQESSELYPTWTVKELLAHLTGWDAACAASLQAFARGDAPVTPAASGIDPYNAVSVREREVLTLEQMFREWEQTRNAFKRAILELPEAKVSQPFVMPWGQTATLADMVKVFVEHEIEHAEEIRQKSLDNRPGEASTEREP